MTDCDVIETLAEKAGGIKALASAISVSRQTLWYWHTNGVSALGRFQLNGFAKKSRIKLPDDFMERGA